MTIETGFLLLFNVKEREAQGAILSQYCKNKSLQFSIIVFSDNVLVSYTVSSFDGE